MGVKETLRALKGKTVSFYDSRGRLQIVYIGNKKRKITKKDIMKVSNISKDLNSTLFINI